MNKTLYIIPIVVIITIAAYFIINENDCDIAKNNMIAGFDNLLTNCSSDVDCIEYEIPSGCDFKCINKNTDYNLIMTNLWQTVIDSCSNINYCKANRARTTCRCIDSYCTTILD